MRIHFLGAAQTVTGAQFLLEVNGHTLLLECGLYQGKREESYRRNQTFAFDPSQISAAILSHAHIDHSGNLPNLVKQGFAGPIYTTPATAALADIMVRDSAHVLEADVNYVNKKRRKRGEPPLEPLYTVADAEKVAPLFRGIPYQQPFEPIPGVQATLVDAGHILGSAAIVLDIEEQGQRFRLWFSGDIGRERLPLLRDPVLPEKADFLMMECTYGDRPHHDPEEAYQHLREVTQRTLTRGGKVIIPAFAVGRTQELVYCYNRMLQAGEIPPVPIYVDSPLAVAASRIFQHFADLFDEETRASVQSGGHPALSYPQLHYIQSVEESRALNDRMDPMIIISASGMAEAGRILHHLKHNIQNPRNTIVIVSWQAPDTLGRRLVEGAPVVRIFGELFDRRAEVVAIDGFSAHAGQDMLLHYAEASRASLRRIILVHGEPTAADALREKMLQEGLPKPIYPAWGETLTLP
jgi:metallo-beta-lactamase family protein